MNAGGSAPPIVVIGAGVGGLAVSIRLAHLGHRVIIVERAEVVGGKLATLERDGYRFDIGPSLVTLPQVFAELFTLAGRRLDDEVDLVRLDPQFSYFWPDGSTLVVADDPRRTMAAVEGFSPGSGDAWRRFIEHGERIWEVSERTFFAGPMKGLRELLGRMHSPRDLTDIDALRSLWRAASAYFADPRLRQWAGRYATYSGSSPYRAPATLGCIPAIESLYGCWYPRGGLGALRDAIERLAIDSGVELRTGTEAVAVIADREQVLGVELATGGGLLEASQVVVNADARHLYRDLLADPAAERRVRRARPSTSGVVVCAGVRGATPDITHHNVWFSDDYRGEFDALAAGRFPDDPTVYGCISSITDDTQAPSGCENWFLLANAPAGIDLDPVRATEVIMQRLQRSGIALGDRIEFVETITPRDLEDRYRAPGGAIYGSSSDGRRAAFARPGNIGSRRGLYLVGGSSHPGGGLPLVTMSARIVADLIGPAAR